MSEIPKGRFVWYDLLTPDPDAAISFYTELLGWGTDIFAGADKPYTMWTNNGAPIGGVMQLPEGAAAPPNWLAYVSSPDLHKTVERARELGAEIVHEPQEIPTVGSFAVVQDPQGAVQAVYTPANIVPGHDGPPQPGEFSWHELATSDHDAALEFYSDLYGWKAGEAMDMGPMGTYQIYVRGEMPLGGIFKKPDEIPGPPFWLYYAMVDDVDQKIQRVKDLGGKILNGPMEVPGGDKIAQCLDPQGAAFALHSRAAS